MKISKTLDDLRVPIDSLKPRKGNARRGNLSIIKESLEVNGQYRPIVVNSLTSEILAGNHTYQAAKALGWKEIAATFVEASEEEARKIVLIDNKANDLSGYDEEALFQMLKELKGDLVGTGFSKVDITELLQSVGAAAEKEGKTDPDQVPETPQEPKTKPGDIYQLGEHRLICGDSTDPEVLSQLMDGKKADLLLTDPPYGVSYAEKNRYLNEADNGSRSEENIENDQSKGDELEKFLSLAFEQAASHIKPGTPVYCFSAEARREQFNAALRAANIEPRQWLVWVKHHFVLGLQDYQYQHEPIIYGWLQGGGHKWYGGYNKSNILKQTKNLEDLTKPQLLEVLRKVRKQLKSSVQEYPKPARSELHPTTKPVPLLTQLIHNSSAYDDLVLDIFGGSGSTLIAAEKTHRTAYLVELDPAYCDVIAKRYEDFTGYPAEKITEKKSGSKEGK